MTGKSSAVAVALLTALWAYWFAPADVSYPLPPGELHAVTVTDGTAVVDLPFATAGEQYLLVVSNLSRDVAPRRIALRSRPVDRVERVPLRRVADLGATAVSAVRSGDDLGATAVSAVRSGVSERTFWLNVDGGGENPAAFRPIIARPTSEGSEVRVFVDRDDDVDAATVSATIALFDAVVQPRYAERIGTAPDVDGDGKLAIVLTGWLGRMQGGMVSVGGLVQPQDFDRGPASPYSNRADVVFLNAATRPGAHLQNLLAHEYAHAVLSGTRSAAVVGDVVYEDAWLDEAIAHQAEGLFGASWSNLDYRVAAFLAAPHEAPLAVADYRREGLWRSPAPRGHAFLFLRWCGERYGTRLLPALVASRRSGRENVAAATGEPFDELFRRFSADLPLRELRPTEDGEEQSRAGTMPSLCLTEPLGAWPLAGPRRERWNLNAERDARDVAVSGTGSAYYLLSATRPGPRRLTLEIEAGGALQMSLVRLPDDLPRLAVRVVGASGGAQSLEIVERGGRAATIEQIAWGPLAFAPQAAAMHVCVRGAAVGSLLSDAWLPGGGRLLSRTIDFAALPPGEVYVSVVARDESGRRATAWTSFDPSAAEPPLAAVSRPRKSG